MRTVAMPQTPPSELIVQLVTWGIVALGFVVVRSFGWPSDIVVLACSTSLVVAFVLLGAAPGGRVSQITRRHRPIMFWFVIGTLGCFFVIMLGHTIEGQPPSKLWTFAGIVVWLYSPMWGVIERDRRKEDPGTHNNAL